MSKKKLIVGNWKMHLNVAESLLLVGRLDNRISASTKVEVVLCPAFIALEPLRKHLKPLKFKLGAQNLYHADEGLLTGEVSGAMLRGLVGYAIIGHSERRRNFGEDDQIIARKVSAALRNQITPILCIGEDLDQRQEQQTLRVLHDQLVSDLTMLTAEDVSQIVVVYEPVWSISAGDGHGDIAKPDQISQALKFIRKTIAQLYGKTAAEQVRLLYGGSVNMDFAQDYLRVKELDGFLVGGASLNSEEFVHIVKTAQGTVGRLKSKISKKAEA